MPMVSVRGFTREPANEERSMPLDLVTVIVHDGTLVAVALITAAGRIVAALLKRPRPRKRG